LSALYFFEDSFPHFGKIDEFETEQILAHPLDHLHLTIFPFKQKIKDKHLVGF